MSQSEDEYWERLRRALSKLEKQYINQPEVSLIDIGYDPAEKEGKQLVLRVHVRQMASGLALKIPTEVDGIPVRLIRGDYQLE